MTEEEQDQVKQFSQEMRKKQLKHAKQFSPACVADFDSFVSGYTVGKVESSAELTILSRQLAVYREALEGLASASSGGWDIRRDGYNAYYAVRNVKTKSGIGLQFVENDDGSTRHFPTIPDALDHVAGLLEKEGE